MPEEIKTAETNVEVDNSNADIATEEVNEVEFEDTKEVVQVEQNNSENARRRREAERQKEIKTAKEQAIIETLRGKNPYTDEEMKDSADVEEYLAMREIEAKGGDPLADFSKFQKAKERERVQKQAEDDKQAEWFKRDREEFATKHPEVTLDSLVQDKQFQLFASGKVGTLPLSEIYEGFLEVVSEYEKKAKQMAKQMLANQKASPGALSGPRGDDSGFFTKDQVQKMSPQEVSANYEKIRASMTKWN